MSSHISNERPAPDKVLTDIADYALNYEIDSELAYTTAQYCLMDTLGCGLEALEYPACTKLLGPDRAGNRRAQWRARPGHRIPTRSGAGGVQYWRDDPLAGLQRHMAGCGVGASVDNLGGILATADWLSRTRVADGNPPLVMRDVLTAMIKAHEIQGCIALENSFNKVGLDHVVLVKVASTAVVSQLLGLTREQTIAAFSLAWVDGQSLRTYRHAPNTGSRKSWAAGDATSRAVRLALMARAGEMGYPSVLSAKTWGFYDVLFKGKELQFQRNYGTYVMENVLFKVSFPAEFHAQTAVEAAMTLHAQLAKLGKSTDDIRAITIRTHEACLRIIDKKGPLSNPADRDHCVQYMIAIPLLFGRLTAADYEDAVALDPVIGPRIDTLRAKMHCIEEPDFTTDYHDPEKRSIANSLRVELNDGTVVEGTVEYPIGHRRRREEGLPLLVEKFKTNLRRRFSEDRQQRILEVSLDRKQLESTPVHEYVDLYGL